MEYSAMGEAIKQAISDKEKMVRIAGIDLLGKSSVSPQLMVQLLSNVINTKSTEEKQAALLTLGNMPVKYSAPVLHHNWIKWLKVHCHADVYIELSEAIDSSHDAALKQQYKTIAASLSADELTASYAGSLYGGNVDKGRHIFYQGESASVSDAILTMTMGQCRTAFKWNCQQINPTAIVAGTDRSQCKDFSRIWNRYCQS
jgi:hypothetical protein